MIIRADKGFQRSTVIACAVCLALAAWVMGSHPERWYLGVSGIVFFGGPTVFAGRQWLDSRPIMVIDEHGIAARHFGLIEWRDIRGAEIRLTRHGAWLSLDMREPGKYTQRLPSWIRWNRKLDRLIGMSDVSLSLAGTDADPEQVCEFVLKELGARSEEE